MTLQVAVPACPVCGFASIYTDGNEPCSISCALQLAHEYHKLYSVSFVEAEKLVRAEAATRGLPETPDFRDIRASSYKYVVVRESRLSSYWKLDRYLLDAGLNVEYLWLSRKTGQRGRIYRFAPELLQHLPESIQDYNLVNLSTESISWLDKHYPMWYFLWCR